MVPQPSSSSPPPPSSSKTTPYFLSIYKYRCHGALHLTSDKPGSSGVCRGLQSRLEHCKDAGLTDYPRAVTIFQRAAGGPTFNPHAATTANGNGNSGFMLDNDRHHSHHHNGGHTSGNRHGGMKDSSSRNRGNRGGGGGGGFHDMQHNAMIYDLEEQLTRKKNHNTTSNHINNSNDGSEFGQQQHQQQQQHHHDNGGNHHNQKNNHNGGGNHHHQHHHHHSDEEDKKHHHQQQKQKQQQEEEEQTAPGWHDWSCYGSTDVHLLVLRDVRTQKETIAGAAPSCLFGASLRDIGTERGGKNVASIHLGLASISLDSHYEFPDEQQQQQKHPHNHKSGAIADSPSSSYSSSSPPNGQNSDKEEERGNHQSNPSSSSSSSTSTMDRRGGALGRMDGQQMLNKFLDTSGKIVHSMKKNAVILQESVSEDFPTRTYRSGQLIAGQFGKTAERTAHLMGSVYKLWRDDDDDDHDDPHRP